MKRPITEILADWALLLFGTLMDDGHPAALFIGVALFQTLAIATAVGASANGRAPVPHKA